MRPRAGSGICLEGAGMQGHGCTMRIAEAGPGAHGMRVMALNACDAGPQQLCTFAGFLRRPSLAFGAVPVYALAAHQGVVAMSTLSLMSAAEQHGLRLRG